MLSLVDMIAFQAIVVLPGGNICPRRKLPLMFVVWILIALICPFRAFRARTCGQRRISLFPLHPDRAMSALQEIFGLCATAGYHCFSFDVRFTIYICHLFPVDLIFSPRSLLMHIVNLVAILKFSVRSPAPTSRIRPFVDNIPFTLTTIQYIARHLTRPLSSMLLGRSRYETILFLNLRDTYYQPFSSEMTLIARYEALRSSCGQFIPFVQNVGLI